MFTCLLLRYVASTVSVAQPFTDFREGADTVRLTGAISVDRCGEISTCPLNGVTNYGGVRRKTMLGVGVRSRTRVINE